MDVRATGAVLALLSLAACGRSGVHLEDYVPFGVEEPVLRFSGEVGDLIPPQTVTLLGVGSPTDAWQATAGAPWVLLSPASATGVSSLEISVRSRDLPPGSHATSVRFETTALDGTTATATLAVELLLTAPGWTSLDGPYAGQVNTVAVDSADDRHVIAGTYRGRLFTSYDGGATFTFLDRITSHEVYDLALTTSGRGYAATAQDGVLISSDGGVSWGPSGLQGVGVISLAVSASNDLHALAVGGGNVWATVDGGETWNGTATDERPVYVGIHQGVPGEFIVSAYNGIFYLTDGVTFNAKTSGGSGTTYSVVVLTNGDWLATHECHEGAYRSSDQGATWTNAGVGLPDGAVWLALDGDAIWAATWYGAFLSEDDGATFNHVADSFRCENETIRQARAHPDGTLFAHRTGGVARYVPGTGLVKSALYGDVITDIELVPATGRLYGIGSRGSIFEWTATGGFVSLGGSGVVANENRWVAPDPRSSAFVCVGAYEEFAIQCTEDGGATWRTSAVGLTGWGYELHRAPDDPDVLWASTNVAVFRSTDNGLSFSQMPIADGYHGRPMAVISREQALLTGGSGAHLGRFSATTGTTDAIDNVACTPSLLRRARDGSLWYGGFDVGLYRSDDGGVTFTSWGALSDDATDVEVDPTRPGRVYLSTYTGLFVTTDSGDTWAEVGAPFGVTTLDVDPDTGTVYAGTDVGGIYLYSPP